MEQLERLNELTFKTPSGFDVTIREQNGDDDDIISRIKDSKDGTAMAKFLAGLVLHTSESDGKRISYNDILKWKNRDKYYTLLKSRIFSLSSEITYKHTCSNSDCNKEETYEEDLSLYDTDFNKPTEPTFKYRIQAYKQGTSLQAEITLSSGKKIKYKYLSGLSEKKMLDIPKDELSKNTEFRVRDLELELNGVYLKLENFKLLSARDMAEIRKHMVEYDSPFEAVSEAKCPHCGNIDYLSLLSETSFFFPLGI